MKIIIVKPSDKNFESLSVIIFSLLVILISGFLIILQNNIFFKKGYTENEISVFDNLTTVEQGIYNDLFSAKDEILFLFELKNDWPLVLELENEFISPFVKDSAWKSRGEFFWQQKKIDSVNFDIHSTCMFLGYSKDKEIGSFLLILYDKDKASMEEKHTNFEIWYNKKTIKAFPATALKDDLIRYGWKTTVPYTGNEEFQRLKGRKN